MTVCCGSRESPTGAYPGSWSESRSGSSSRSPASVTRRSGRRFRSTKGASKARRDHINAEIRNMRSLLPIPPEDRERLSYLHSMSAICTFVRKSLFFRELHGHGGSGPTLPYELFLQALPGFMVVASREGRLLYVSENVSDFLGFSMVDMLQGDTFYDMVDSADVGLVKSNLEKDDVPSAERSFVCCMHTSKAFRLRHGPTCFMLVRGRFHSPPGSSSSHPDLEQAFVALCTPTVDCQHDGTSHGSVEPFGTLHRADMSFSCAPYSVLFFLGYSPQEMMGRSWYSMVHPEDLRHSASRHRSLLEADEGTLVEMVLRLQRKDLAWVWVYIRATKDSGKQEVSCMNYIIGETEAVFLRQRVHADDAGPSTALLSEVPRLRVQGDTTSGPLKRQGDASSPSEEPQAKRTCDSGSGSTYTVYTDRACSSGQQVALMSSVVFPVTPPYSPASLHCPLTPEDGGSRVLLDTCGYTETLLSPVESSSPYVLSHGALPDPARIATDPGFGFPDFTAPPFQSPGSCPSPSYELSVYPAASRLVPGCLQVADVSDYSLDDTFHPDDFCLPDLPQGGDSPFLLLQEAPGLLTPDPSPTGEGHFQYSEREQTEISILARQISSLASSFDMFRSTELPLGSAAEHVKVTADSDLAPPCGLPQPASHPFRPELVLDEGLIDSVLQDMGSGAVRDALDGLSLNPSAFEDGAQVLDSAEGQSVSFLFTLLEDVSLDQLLGAQPALDSTLRTGRPQDSSELHQLGRYLDSSFQQDDLVEESAC